MQPCMQIEIFLAGTLEVSFNASHEMSGLPASRPARRR